jgi:hypothetical protein
VCHINKGDKNALPDAEYIVHAVNMHPKLVDALTWAMGQVHPYTRRIPDQNIPYCDDYDAALAILEECAK